MKEAKKKDVWQALSLVIIGLGLGWLVGLSVSPVVSTVIAAFTAIISTLIGALAGFERKQIDRTEGSDGGVSEKTIQVSAVPLAFVVLGLIVGSGIGIAARNYHWLGNSTKMEYKRWVELGIPRNEVSQALFAREMKRQVQEPLSKDHRDTVLYSEERTRECTRLMQFSERPKKLVAEAAGSTDPTVRLLTKYITDEATLMEALKKLCEQ